MTSRPWGTNALRPGPVAVETTPDERKTLWTAAFFLWACGIRLGWPLNC